MANKNRQFLKDSNRDFNNILDSMTYSTSGVATSLVNAGTNDTAMTIVQPANTYLIDAGVIVSVAIAGSSGNINVKIGTADDGAQVCANAALMSSATAVPVGVVLSHNGKGEGAANLAFVADVALFTATERTLHVRAEASAAITAGTLIPFIVYGCI